ncbi:MAG: hypothetical protein WCF68_04435 [Terriglobales bacterium]
MNRVIAGRAIAFRALDGPSSEHALYVGECRDSQINGLQLTEQALGAAPLQVLFPLNRC